MSYAKYFTLLILTLYTSTTCADTLLQDKSFFSSETLTLKKSPYVVRGNLTVHPGVTLTIESGVKMIFEQGSMFVRQGGYIKMKGVDLQVKTPTFSALIAGDHADIRLETVHIYSTTQPLIEVWNHSTLYIEGLVADAYSNESTGHKHAITVFDDSELTARDIEISNWQGVVLQVFSNSTVIITESVFENNHKAFEVFDSHITLHHNDFVNNTIAGERITDKGNPYIVDAKNNWWGSITGPGDTIAGDVLYTPWSAERHKKKDTTCCSNILFLPGLMGSRLSRDGGTFENQLWEPNRNADVKKLFLNPKGQGIDPTIYTRDVIHKTNIVGGFGVVEQNLYLDFIKALDVLVKDKKVNRFVSAPYDWRYAPDTILQDGIIQGSKTDHQTVSLVETIRKLAADSKTKKVTIITHSNGGLVAKQLMIELKKLNIDSMVDKVIFVAMPEFGTPQAITGLLFGHDQTIANGLILKSSVAKELAHNMPTAYTLLPAETYFQNLENPLNFAGSSITNASTLREHLSQFTQTNIDLLSQAQTLHQSLDSWIPPHKTEVFQIIGTGLPTVSGLVLLEHKKDDGKFLPEYTTSGDGVVQMSHGRTGRTIVIDLQHTNYKHMNIMNSPQVITKAIELLKLPRDLTQTSISLVQPTPALGAPISASYKMIHISPISGFLPTGLTLDTTYQVDPNPTAESKYKYDKYVTGYSQYFDSVIEQSNMNRFELFGNDVHYLYMNDAETVTLSNGDGAGVDIRLLDKQGDSLTELSFPTVVSSKGSGITIDKNENMIVMIPLVDQVVTIEPTKKTVFDATGQVIEEQQLVSTTTETLEDKVTRIKQSIITSNITPYIKTRYIRMLDVYLKNKDKIYAGSITSRITRAMSSTYAFSRNPYLWGRYKKLYQDYVYLSYLLVNI